MEKQRLVVAIVVRDGVVLSYATNEHKKPCKRIGSLTGQNYELCEECDYPNHAEVKALKGIPIKELRDIEGSKLFLFGHTYACTSCLKAIKKAKLNLVLR